MKICLINPPQILPQTFGLPVIFQPLALAYLAAVLEKKHEVKIIDASGEGWENLKKEKGYFYMGLDFDEIKKRVSSFKPEVVGIAVPFSVNEESAFSIVSLVKSIDRKIITILGGPHPTVRPRETLSLRDVDFIVMAEGEYSFLELADNLDKNLENVLGIGYKKNGEIKITPCRPFIEKVDQIPFPARHLLPMEEYFEAMQAGRGSRQAYVFNDRWTSIITSRGCPYNCTFCSIHTIAGRKFRPRSPENVILEIEEVINKFNIKHICFEDDNFTLDRERALRIFNLIIEKKLDISWSAPNGIRADKIDEEMVQKMKQSGCRRVFVAPESGVQRVLDNIIKKKMDLAAIEKAVILFKKYGIIIDGSFVIGLIGETKKDIWATVRYAYKLKRLGMNTAGIHLATPLFGTELYREAKEKGYLKQNLEGKMLATNEPLIDTPEWHGREIRRIQQFANWFLNYSFTEKILKIIGYIIRCLKK